ncbi:MAG: 30S ribosomal protein S2, partial [archaeon]|nr:30S ribosomal protein S2 [archaeon]
MAEKKEETKKAVAAEKKHKEEKAAVKDKAEAKEKTGEKKHAKSAEKKEYKEDAAEEAAKEAPKKIEQKEEPKQKKELRQSDSDDDIGEKQTALVETERYLNAGAHIGTKFKSGDMKKYIYKMRKDGLHVLDVQILDERLKFAAAFLAKYEPRRIMVVSRKVYGQTPSEGFAQTLGAKAITGRFVPGTFTNPESTRFVEPSVVLITDPESDGQAILEATK